MTESVTHSRANSNAEAAAEVPMPVPIQNSDQSSDPPSSVFPTVTPVVIIWTPRFIVLFSLVLTLGLSLASLLTQGWQNRYYSSEWILVTETALILATWIAVLRCSRASWARFAAIFGSSWAIFTCLNFATSLLNISADQPFIAYLNVLISCSLLGCYISLSLHRIPQRRWDIGFLTIAPALGGALVIIATLFTPVEARSLPGFASLLAAVALYLSIATWWLRPSCWKAQPGPAFFLGIAPLILLLLAIPDAFNSAANFFFLQVSLLCSLLGALRILQGEIRYNAFTE
jgi:hypothetical protein